MALAHEKAQVTNAGRIQEMWINHLTDKTFGDKSIVSMTIVIEWEIGKKPILDVSSTFMLKS